MTAQDVTEPAAPVKKRSFGRYVIVLIAVAFVGLLAYGLAQSGDQRVESGKAPDFTLKTFDGQTIKLSELEGRPVVVNFWATWCEQCKVEANDLEMAWRDYKNQGVQFIGVDYLDQEPGNFDYLKRYDITYPNGMDIQGRIYTSYGVQGLPETFVINQQGEVVKVFIGAASREELTAEIEKVLAAQS